MLGSINFEGFNIEEARRWGNALLRSRDTWADAYRGGRRYSDRDQARERISLVRRGGGQ